MLFKYSVFRMLKKSMPDHQQFSSPSSQGCFFLPSAQAMSQIACFTSQTYVHPDRFDTQGCWYRLLEIEEKPVAIKVLPSGTVLWFSPERLEETLVQQRMQQLLISLPLPQQALLLLPQKLGERFLRHMPLTHIASPSFGEAVIKAVIRQVISASHARKLLHRLITEQGPALEYEGTIYYSFPSLKHLAHLSPEVLQAEGLGYKSRLLPRIASDLLERQVNEKARHLSTEAVVEWLQQIKGIGRWTARVAACDVTGDWSAYPVEDLAVRTWAARLWPEYPWPTNERDFFSAWNEVNGEYTGIVTFYLLSQTHFVAQSEPPEAKQLALF